MAKIYFYDSTDLDREQLGDAMKETDHQLEYIAEKISRDNCHEDAEVISIFVTSTVTREMIDAMPNLKLIACRSTGFNNVDINTARDRGITIVNVPTYGESTVAEYAFTLLLSLTRKMPQTFSANHGTQQSDLRGLDLEGQVMGVIGTGHIGQKSIHIARGFGMEVIAFDPYPNEEAARELGFTYKDFDEVMARSDFITLHAPFTPQTHHIINYAALEKMKSSAILVNTARGELVDTKALIVALSENKIAGAALDVIEGEALMQHDEEVALLRSDLISSHQLLHSVEILTLSKMPNVIITPHNAFNTVEAIKRINEATAQNIISYWYGDTPNKVKPPKISSGKLVMVRHAESEWNASGKWTGTRDVHLSENGFREAAVIGHKVNSMGIVFDVGFCSEQIRTLETLEAILNSTGQVDVPILRSSAMNERDYGEYTGMNKWEVRDKIGEEQWESIRRGWNVDVPDGETLKQVYERTVPYFKNEILPLLKKGKNVLLVAHGNSLRALIKYIESIPDEAVPELEMLFGDVVEYELNSDGKLGKKDVTHVNFEEINAKYKSNALEISRNIG